MRREVLQPDSFLKTKALIESLVRPHCLSCWRCFIASLATKVGNGYLTTTIPKLETLPTVTHEDRAGITINVCFLINEISFWNTVPHSKHKLVHQGAWCKHFCINLTFNGKPELKPLTHHIAWDFGDSY